MPIAYKLFAVLIATLLFTSGCTKQESKENLRNIKTGVKNTWHNVKEGVSDATQEFKEESR